MQKQLTKLRIISRNNLPLLVYALLSVAILGSLLLPGHIITLDSTQVFNSNPVNRFYGLDQGVMATSAGILLDFVNNSFSQVLPPWVFGKILLFLLLFLAGLGAHRLIGMKGIGSYFAGILYMINPFTYVRFMAGQWGVLWAYAFLPFAVKAFLELMESNRARDIIKVTLLATFVGLLDIHGFFLLILVFLVLFLFHVISNRKQWAKLQQIVKSVTITAGAFLSLNLYWLIPILTSKNTLLSQIGQPDQFFFAPHSTSTLGVMFDVASLWGFWKTDYLHTSNFIPFWWVLFLIILIPIIYAALFNRSKTRWLTQALTITAIIAFLLAVGAASGFTQPVFNWLWQHIFFFRGFRDSQKFVVLLCLSYAYLGGVGLNQLFYKWEEWKKQKIGLFLLYGLAFITIFAYSIPIFGFHGQLGTTDYPPGWHAVNDYLNRDEEDFNVLFLPWHEYMNYSWSPDINKVLAVPAHLFFDKPIIAGDNMEAGGIYSQSTNPISNYIEFLLSKGMEVSNLGELLAPLDVKYIILVDETDYRLYHYLYQQQDLKIVMEKQGITLFENEHPTARVYSANSVVNIQSLDEFIKFSQTQDVMEHVYTLDIGADVGTIETYTPINVTEDSPICYQTGVTLQNYTIFTVPQDVSTENWEYNGRKSVMNNLGFMPVFESAPDGGEIVYTRFFQIYLPSYIVSFATLAGMITYLLWRKIRRF